MQFFGKSIAAVFTGIKRLVMFYVILMGITILAGMSSTIPSQLGGVFTTYTRANAIAEVLSTQETCTLVEPRDVSAPGRSNVVRVPCQDVEAELAKRPANTKRAGRKQDVTIAFDTAERKRIEAKTSFHKIGAPTGLKVGDRIPVTYDRAQPESSVGPPVQDDVFLRHASFAVIVIAAVLYIGMRVRRTMYWAFTVLWGTVFKPQSAGHPNSALGGAIAKAGPWAERIAKAIEHRADVKAASMKPAPMANDSYRTPIVRKPAPTVKRTPTVRRASSWGWGR